MALQYLFDPNKQFQDRNGTNNVAGFLKVFLNGTDDYAVTYSDFNGTINPDAIVLDTDGRGVVIVDDTKVYRLEVYTRGGTLMWTVPNYRANGGSGGSGNFVEVEGTESEIDVTRTTEGGIVKFVVSIASAFKSSITALNTAVTYISAGLSGKKAKQAPAEFTGSTEKTITDIAQDEDGVLTVTFGDIKKEIFLADYSNVTYSELLTAIEDGKFPVVKKTSSYDMYYMFAHKETDRLVLEYLEQGTLYTMTFVNDGTTVSNQYNMESRSNKTSNITANSTSTTKYPTTKGVHDYVTGMMSNMGGNLITDNGNPFSSSADLPTNIADVSNHDYAYVVSGYITERWSATVEGGTVTWQKEYEVDTSAFLTAPISFTEAESVANIDSGETMPTMLGKIKKWYTDILSALGDLAFLDNLPFTKLSGVTGNSYLKGNGMGGLVERTYSQVKTDLSLNNVTNDAQVKRTEMGVANGVATLNADGIVNLAQANRYSLYNNTASTAYRVIARVPATQNSSASVWSMILSIRSANASWTGVVQGHGDIRASFISTLGNFSSSFPKFYHIEDPNDSNKELIIALLGNYSRLQATSFQSSSFVDFSVFDTDEPSGTPHTSSNEIKIEMVTQSAASSNGVPVAVDDHGELSAVDLSNITVGNASNAINVDLVGSVKTISTTNGDTIQFQAGSGTAGTVTIVNSKHSASADVASNVSVSDGRSSGTTYRMLGITGSTAGNYMPKVMPRVKTYWDANNGDILTIGNDSADGTNPNSDKGRVYMADGAGHTLRLTPTIPMSANREIVFPDAAGTVALQGGTYSGMTVGNATTATTATNATHATSADSATTATTATNATNVALVGSVKTTSTTNGDTIQFKAGTGTAGTVTIVNAKHSASADSATDATYATKIGFSGSHPQIGSLTTPVFVNADGIVKACSIFQPIYYYGSATANYSSAHHTFEGTFSGTGFVSQPAATKAPILLNIEIDYTGAKDCEGFLNSVEFGIGIQTRRSLPLCTMPSGWSQSHSYASTSVLIDITSVAVTGQPMKIVWAVDNADWTEPASVTMRVTGIQYFAPLSN